MAPTVSFSTRWLLLPAGLTVLIAVLALLGLDRGTSPEDGTPEAAVRDFVEALDDRDVAGVRVSLSAELQGRCTDDDLRRGTRDRPHSDQRLRLTGTERVGDTVEVEVRRTRYRSEPPFGDGSVATLEVFTLEQHGGRWVITEVPWSLDVCGGWRR